MAGRRRRNSDSSASAADERPIKWKRESAVLKRAERDIPSNEWPCFVLLDAVIYHKDGKTMANALKLDLDGPFIVRGKLEEDKDLPKYLVKSSLRKPYIEIAKSWSYSIGWMAVRPYPVLWVSGEAGWFEIRPHASYVSMYNHMCQGISLYYGIVGAYESYERLSKKKKKRVGKVELDDLFLKYAVSVGDGVVRDEVVARCDEHAAFLLSHFPKETDFTWDDTTFYKWMRERHASLQKKLDEAPLPPLPEDAPRREDQEATADASTEDDNESDDNDVIMQDAPPSKPQTTKVGVTDTASAKPSGKPTKLDALQREPPQPVPVAPSAPASAELTAAEQQIFQAYLDVLHEIADEAPSVSSMAQSTVHAKVYSKCKLHHYQTGKDVSCYFASHLLRSLGPRWKGTKYAKWLEAMTKTPFTPSVPWEVRNISQQLTRRSKNQVPGVKAGTPGAGAGAADADAGPSSRQGMKNPPPPTAGRRSGKQAGLRPASGKKRYHSEMDDDDDNNAPGGRMKMAKAFSAFGDDDTEDMDDSNDEAATPSARGRDAAERQRPTVLGAVAQPVPIVVRAEQVPSTTPTRHNGTWKCDECDYIVRGADAAAGRELIDQHFHHHEEEAERIELAVTESTRGHMPINHLLEKLRTLGAKAMRRAPATEDAAPRPPSPIKRSGLLL